MKPQDRKALEHLARTLESSLATVRSLLKDECGISERKPTEDSDITNTIASLKATGRQNAEGRLNEMKQKELGAIFVGAGGPSSDRKRPKVWLVEQILWRLFDFERGHEAIRSKGEN